MYLKRHRLLTHSIGWPLTTCVHAVSKLLFTPVVGLVGGAVLGVAAVGKYVVTGRILGISGASTCD